MYIKKVLFFGFLIILCFLAGSFILFSFNQKGLLVKYSELMLFVTYFYILFIQIKTNGLFHLFTLFLFTFFLFTLGIPFLDLLGVVHIKGMGLFVLKKLSDRTLFELYTYMLFFLMFTFWGSTIGRKSDEKKEFKINYNALFLQLGFCVFFIAMPGLILKYYLQLHVVLQKGYLAIYDGSFDKINYPLICMGSGTLLILGYCLILTAVPSKKVFFIFTFIFIALQVLNVLKGQRSVLMLPLIFVLWYYYNVYGSKIAMGKIFLVVFTILVVSQSLQYYREGRVSKDGFFGKYVFSFFKTQGVSVFIPAYQIEFKKELKNDRYPYMLTPLMPNANQYQSMKRLHDLNYLSDKVAYFLTPDGFKKGFGTGSSIIGLFYDLPILVAIGLAILLGWFISWFNYWVMSKRILFFLSFYIVTSIVAAPRYELLVNVYNIFIFIFIYFIVLVIERYAHTVCDRRTAISNT